MLAKNKLARNRASIQATLPALYTSPNTYPKMSICSYARVTIENRTGRERICLSVEREDETVCWCSNFLSTATSGSVDLQPSCCINLRRGNDAIYGLMSSHPAASLAAAKAFFFFLFFFYFFFFFFFFPFFSFLLYFPLNP